MNTLPELKCDVCGEPAVGVASSCMPISFAYCRTCLQEGAEPIFIFEYHYDDVSHDGKGLADWFTQCVKSYKDGKYITWDEFCEWRKSVGREKSEPCDYPGPDSFSGDIDYDIGGSPDDVGVVLPDQIDSEFSAASETPLDNASVRSDDGNSESGTGLSD